MKLKRNIILNKRNGQASITIPSKFLQKLEQTPKQVILDFSNSTSSAEVRTKKSG